MDITQFSNDALIEEIERRLLPFVPDEPEPVDEFAVQPLDLTEGLGIAIHNIARDYGVPVEAFAGFPRHAVGFHPRRLDGVGGPHMVGEMVRRLMDSSHPDFDPAFASAAVWPLQGVFLGTGPGKEPPFGYELPDDYSWPGVGGFLGRRVVLIRAADPNTFLFRYRKALGNYARAALQGRS